MKDAEFVMNGALREHKRRLTLLPDGMGTVEYPLVKSKGKAVPELN
jgi:hypothetical protein